MPRNFRRSYGTKRRRIGRYGRRRGYRRVFKGRRFSLRRRLNNLARRFRIGGTRTTIRSSTYATDRCFVKLKYVKTPFSLASGTIATMLGNDCYDPDPALGGFQPVGYDEYSGIWNNWRVWASRIKVEAVQHATGGYQPARLGIFYQRTNTLTGFPTDAYLLNPGWKWRFMRSVMNIVDPGGGASSSYSSNVTKLTHYARTKKLYADRDVTGPEFEGATGGSPVSKWYWIIANYNDWAEAPAILIVIRLTYYVEFYNRKQLFLS